MFKLINRIRALFSNFGNHLYEEKSQIKANIISNQFFLFSIIQLLVICSLLFYYYQFSKSPKLSPLQFQLNFYPALAVFVLLAMFYVLKNISRHSFFEYFSYILGIAYIAGMSLMHGKDSGIQYYLFVLMPVPFFGLAASKRYMILAGTIFCALVIISVMYAQHVYPPWQRFNPTYRLTTYVISVSMTLLGLFFSSFYLWRQTNVTERELIQEKTKTESLLKSILPEQIISQIRDTGKATPVFYDSSTVLFTDFVGFTRISETLSPQELVEELHLSFSYFDAVMKRYHLEKLKTIGDSYMAVGGLPSKNETHAIDAVLAAIEIISIIQQVSEIRRQQKQKMWQIRIGIHTGPVVAGVIGEEKFSYDVWGDTVNTASRMESSGEAGKINISQHTYEMIEPFFDCTYRGKIEAKNKGLMKMYFVNGIKKDMMSEIDYRIPNEKFTVAYAKMKKRKTFQNAFLQGVQQFLDEDYLGKLTSLLGRRNK